MTVREIAGFLNKKYPEKAAEDFDNPGLIFGSGLWDVSSVLVASPHDLFFHKEDK